MRRLFRFWLLGLVVLLGQAPNLIAQSGTKLWDYTTAFLIDASPAIGTNGTIFVPSYENIYAMTSAGSNLWVSDVNNFPGIFGSPAVGGDGTVYFGGSADGIVYALNPLTGANRWTYSISGNGVFYTTPAIGTDGTIYIGSYKVMNNDTPYMYAFNTNGTLRWRYAPAASIYSSAAISPDGATVYFGSDDGKVYALSTNGTTLRWTFNTGPKAITGAPAIGADGKIYIGVGSITNPKFYCINTNGTTNWVFACTNRIQNSAVIGDDGTVYFGSDDMHLYAVNTNGVLKWAAFTGATNASTPAIAADGTIYIGSDNHKLYAFDSNGSNVWTFTAGGVIFSSPVIGTNGVVYVGSEDAKVYAINGSSGLARTPWPMFQHDVRHTSKYTVVVNTQPTITLINNQTNNANSVVGPLAFTVFDAETPSGNLMVSGVSSNTTLVPNGQLVFSGTSSNRFLTGTPAANQSGLTLITVTVTDAAGGTNSTSFLLAILAGNQPPVLAGVSNRVIGAGVTLIITNSATDPDVPAQTLLYSLPAAPAGALINTNSGVFTWRPVVAQANSTNVISVKVADNGTPSLTATQSFQVIVNPLNLPVFSAISMTNGTSSFRVNGDFGPDYLVQTSTNLVNWSPAFTNFSPVLPFNWADTNSPASPVRFYRILLMP